MSSDMRLVPAGVKYFQTPFSILFEGEQGNVSLSLPSVRNNMYHHQNT